MTPTQATAMPNTQKSYLLLAFLAGCLVPGAFKPLNFYLLAVIAPALLLLSLWQATPRQALSRGFSFGLGLFGVGISWVFISIYRYGNTNLPLAALLTALFICVLATLPALQAYCFARFYPKPNLKKLFCAFPALWVLFEWIRSWLFTGFPWLILGDSQTSSPLRGFAPLIGEFGLSLLLVLSSMLLLTSFARVPGLAMPTLRWRQHQLKLTTLSRYSLIILWATAAVLSTLSWTQPHGQPRSVSLVQGNVPQEVKWSPDYLNKITALYPKLTQKYWGSDIIVWPEGAIPTTIQYASAYLAQLNNTATQHHTALLLGIPDQAKGTLQNYYNSVLALGNGHGLYYKRHLVPFGEYVPFESWLRGLIGFFNIPMSSFIPGPAQQPLLTAQGVTIAVAICYEIAYSQLLLAQLPQAQLLLTVTDDAWFGDSFAPAQHLQIAQMRALQTGRYLLFSANNGITAIINPKGEIDNVAPQFQEIVLSGNIVPMQGTTPWVQFGHWPILILTMLFLVVALL